MTEGKKSNFTHLHLHTEYSLLDGASHIKSLAARLKEIGQDSVAMTDHGNMFGAVEFYREMVKNGIKPIIGCEVYVAPYGSSRFDKGGKFSITDDKRYHHLILLAKNNTGYKNLCKIVSIGWTEGFYYKPRVDMEVLEKYHEGIICTSACLGGAIPQALLQGDYDLAKKIALHHQSIFGDDYYLEIQDHGLKEQKDTNPDIIRIAKEIGAKVIATNDSHYLRKEDAKTHEVLLAIQTKSTLKDKNRMVFETDEFYVKSEEEMMEMFSYIPEAITNTQEIVDKCNFEMVFGENHLPKFDVPEGFESESHYFNYLVKEGIRERYGNRVPMSYVERAKYEIQVIEEMDFVGYFLIVSDFIKWAKNNDVPVGPGRGSAGGSIVAYLLHITDVDPMKYGLLFERFLNPQRISFPDIDIDFCYNKREKVIEYVTNKYGADRVSQIITFGTIGAKSGIRDVARVMGVKLSVADKIAKAVPDNPGTTLKDAFELSSEFNKLYNESQEARDIIDVAVKLEGTPRHTSIHAAGVIIADDDITNYAPLSASKGSSIVEFHKDIIEDIGLIKMDFLGLRTLTVIDDTIKYVEKRHGVKINPYELINEIDNHPEIYEMLQAGDTTGVFQFESQGMTALLARMYSDISRISYIKTEEEKKALGAEFFDRLIAAVALYRPGPMKFIDAYIDGILDKNSIHYDHPLLKSALENTNGIILYQEQVQKICRDLAGFDYAEADILRRAMGKKDMNIMVAERERFIHGQVDENGKVLIDGCVRRGISEELANKIYDSMMDFALYAFNKSHATAYAMISFQTAYLKYYYPEEFLAALLTSVIGNNDKLPMYINAINKNMNIRILPPDMNISQSGFIPLDKEIFFGLNGVKHVKSLGDKIVEERERGGDFESIYDFLSRMVDNGLRKDSFQSLIKTGMFDSTGYNRRELLNISEDLLQAAKDNPSSQTSLFDFIDNGDYYKYPEIPRMGELSDTERLAYERESIHFYISGHPLYGYEELFDEAGCVSFRGIYESIEANDGLFKDNQIVAVPVVISSAKKSYTKTGNIMSRMVLQDFEGLANAIAWSQAIEKNPDYFEEGEVPFIAKLRISIEDQENVTFTVEELLKLPENERDYKSFLRKNKLRPNSGVKGGRVYFNKEYDNRKKQGLHLKVFDRSEAERIRPILEKYPGESNVIIALASQNNQTFISSDYKVCKEKKELIDKLKEVLGEDSVFIRN